METQELLVKAGVPKDLLRDFGPLKNFPELDGIWPMIVGSEESEPRRVILLFGTPTPYKDRLCAILLRNIMEQRKKKGLWLSPTKIPSAQQWGEAASPFPVAGVTVVVGIDLLTPQQARILSAHMREQVQEDRVFILEASNKNALDEILGKTTMSYLAYYACQLNLVQELFNIPGV